MAAPPASPASCAANKSSPARREGLAALGSHSSNSRAGGATPLGSLPPAVRAAAKVTGVCLLVLAAVDCGCVTDWVVVHYAGIDIPPAVRAAAKVTGVCLLVLVIVDCGCVTDWVVVHYAGTATTCSPCSSQGHWSVRKELSACCSRWRPHNWVHPMDRNAAATEMGAKWYFICL